MMPTLHCNRVDLVTMSLKFHGVECHFDNAIATIVDKHCETYLRKTLWRFCHLFIIPSSVYILRCGCNFVWIVYGFVIYNRAGFVIIDCHGLDTSQPPQLGFFSKKRAVGKI